MRKVRSTKYTVQSGQALVLVLLSLAVVLTLVLFILSRSITDVSITSKNDESVRAFSAAEAGVEQALVIGTGVGSTTIGNAKYSSSVTSARAEGPQEFVYPIEMSSGDTATTWFVDHDASGAILCDATHPCFTGNTFQVCWGKPGTLSTVDTTPAIEISVFYEATPNDLTTIKIARAAIDPFAGRVPVNSFSSPDAGTCSIGGNTYQFQKTILFSDLGIAGRSSGVQGGLQYAKVRMLYNSDVSHNLATSVQFAGNSNLPSQGQAIVSTGIAGQSNRKINVFQGWPENPPVFDFAIYSPSTISK